MIQLIIAKRKVPPPCARTEENVRALNGRRDDDLVGKA
jgi:hypothetical protein